MSIIQLTGFTGIAPRYSDTLLQPNQATVANNVKLWSGEIRPWRKPTLVHTCVSNAIQSVYRLQGPSSSVWLEFEGDTDVCYSPLSDSSNSKIYYSEYVQGLPSGYYVCKKTNYTMATAAGSGAYPRNWYYMGTPAPTEKPEATVVTQPSGADDTQSVVYVFTYVSEFDGVEEESAPSPASAIADASYEDYKVNVVFNKVDGNPASPLVPTDHLNITKIRLYRSLTGSSTVIYEEVDELPLNASTHQLDASGTSTGQSKAWSNYTYQDVITSSGLIKEMDSNYYTPPPNGLQGLVSMPNGFLAGFKDNEVWFSEPYLPHAWPPTYMLTTDSPIVGLGVYGTTLVVCTTRYPYTISGTHPSSMTQERQPMFQPCVSKQSIAYDQYGVVYASPYGLVALAAGQMDVFTRSLITQDEWSNYLPHSMKAVMYNNMYMCAYASQEKHAILIFSRGDEPALVSYDFKAIAMHVERQTGKFYCVREEPVTVSGTRTYQRKIYEMDSDETNYDTFEWVSKRFYLPYWTSFSSMKVDADFTSLRRTSPYYVKLAQLTAYNAAKAQALGGRSLGGELNAIPLNHGGATTFTYENPITHITETMTMIANQGANCSYIKDLPEQPEVVFLNVTGFVDEETIPAFEESIESDEDVRLPSVRSNVWQFRAVGNINVRSILIGTTLREIATPT